MTEEALIKVAILGTLASGKTNIIRQIAEGVFKEDSSATVGIDITKYSTKYLGHSYKMQLIDTAGAHNFMGMAVAYLKNANGLLFLFDLSHGKDIEETKERLKLYFEKKDKSTFFILVGNKKDKNREISTKQGFELAHEFGIPYVEISVKNYNEVEELFRLLLEGIVKGKIISKSQILIDEQKAQNCE